MTDDGARVGRPAGGAAGDVLLYLGSADVAALGIDMAEVVAAVEEGCRLKGEGAVAMPPKLTLAGAGDAFAQAMAAWQRDAEAAVKWVTVVPANRARGRAVVNGLLVLSDGQTGLPLAVMDAALVTALRTGASVAVAARFLARPEVECVGVLGCGVQGRRAVEALRVVLPRLRTVRCHDPDPAAVAALAALCGDLRPPLGLEACRRPADIGRDAGVVVSAITMGGGPPPLDEGVLEPGALAVALDYDAAWTPAAMRACERFFCDDTAAVRATKAAGRRLAGVPDTIAGDLGDLAAGRVPGRRDDRERLFCLNLGMAVEDLVTARLVLARAQARGVGTLLPL